MLNYAVKGEEPVLIPTVPGCHNCSFSWVYNAPTFKNFRCREESFPKCFLIFVVLTKSQQMSHAVRNTKFCERKKF
jgi:hypothetical protein